MISDRDLIQRLGSTGQAFFGRFDHLREIQRISIGPVMDGKDVLLCSATASGKTEALFAPLVARLRLATAPSAPSTVVLVIAPTRALVNDLFVRIRNPLNSIGWSCGRQTSDHRDKTRRPHVLITTPESFDSMLARDSRWQEGKLVGHLLSNIMALFIDEAHLFASSPRGDQVQWLIGRLRRLRQHSSEHNWSSGSHFQVCAASATIPEPNRIAQRLLGPKATVLVAPGSRECEILGTDAQSGWVPLKILRTIDAIYQHVAVVEDSHLLSGTAEMIWRGILQGVVTDCRKVLVFVPSRAMCDQLSLAIRDTLSSRRQLAIFAHHGSLDREFRENAELHFSKSRDAILVATTTLEVGVDIGDVDVVALVGCPPDTSSLLQRIGRAGRRSGVTRVIPIARGELEARALASMLEAAENGALESLPQVRRWGVFIQQALSHTYQGGKRGRARTDLLALAEHVWPEEEGGRTASEVLDSLIEQDVLIQSQTRFFLSDSWSDRANTLGGDLHHNFEDTGSTIPVVDASTGEVLTHVRQPPSDSTSIALAGQRWNTEYRSGEILIKSSSDRMGAQPLKYAARAAPTGAAYAAHLRRGLGFDTLDAPIVDISGRQLWFHFGGSVYESLLCAVAPELSHVRGLSGIAVSGTDVTLQVHSVVSNINTRLPPLLENAQTYVLSESLGRFHSLLPQRIQAQVAKEVLAPERFKKWLTTRFYGPFKRDHVGMMNLYNELLR